MKKSCGGAGVVWNTKQYKERRTDSEKVILALRFLEKRFPILLYNLIIRQVWCPTYPASLKKQAQSKDTEESVKDYLKSWDEISAL